MKQLLVTLDFPPEKGGIQRYLGDIVVHTYGKNDAVLTLQSPRHESADSPPYPCPVHRIFYPCPFFGKKMALLPLSIAVISVCTSKWRPDLLVAGNVYGAIIAGIASLLFKIPYSIYCYGSELAPLSFGISFRKLLIRHLFRHATTIFYLTDSTRKLLLRTVGNKNYLQCTPKIDLPDFSIASKPPHSATITLLSVGRLVPHKGHRVLIDALGIIGTKLTWRLTIAGNGPEYSTLVRYICAGNLEKNIVIATGLSDSDILEYYRRSDLFIFPSIETKNAVEGFGIVLLDAMAYGCAIIASKSGGIPDVFAPSPESAELVPPGDAHALACAITTLANDPARRKTMINAGKRLVETHYVW